MKENFLEEYLEFQKGTEPPTIYHRWCALTGISALLGRRVFVQHGHNKIYPNLYTMIVGESGARKDTGIRAIKNILTGAGYNTIAADKSSKEKWLVDLEKGLDKIGDEDELLDVRNNDKKNPTMRAMFGLEKSMEPTECLIMAGEFNAFLGHGNVEFIDLLTNLWDYDGIYQNRIKTGKSVSIPNPTISILGGNTSTGISMAFPTEVIGQGFFSRLIMVYSDPSGRRIPFPPVPNIEELNHLIELITRIKQTITGEMIITREARETLSEIYMNWKDLDDIRFKSYSTRRFTHLLKLCISCAASTFSKNIDSEVVVYANSILHYCESFMPLALGEFGKAKNASVSERILNALDKSEEPMHIVKDLWPICRRDLNKITELEEILRGLANAGRIQPFKDGKILGVKIVQKFDAIYCNVSMLMEYKENQIKKGLSI